jgi:Fic family protein
MEGDWESWLLFFLEGIAEVSDHAYEMTRKIRTLFEEDEETIRKNGERKKRSMLELYRVAKQIPVFTALRAEKILEQSISKPTIYASAQQLCDLGILLVRANEKGIQVFYYKKYLDFLAG